MYKKVEVKDFIENEETDLVPQIIESKGKSPDQYNEVW